ncbi:MAG: primosomal protein N' [Candidatus Moraniibacteriota bacterium]
MNPSSLYRLEVAPLTILPLGRSPFFSYASDVPIPKGSLITISFGTQTTEGVVFECQVLPGKKPIWMKYFTSIVKESFLTEAQCQLALQVSEEYFTPLGKTLKHFLPKMVVARKTEAVPAHPLKILRTTKEEQILVKKFFEKKQSLPRYLDTALFKDPKKLIALIAKDAIKKEQVLIIVPEIILILGWESYFLDFFRSESLVVLHSKLSAGAFFAAWERIRSGEGRVIIATRQGLFAPFQNLGAIIITEEQDESYKQWDMSPRYHGKRVAAFLASITRARLLYTSSTPSVESLHGIAEKKIVPLQPLAEHASITPALTIVNLKLERYRRNFSPLSEELALSLRDTIDRGGQALLYINRQGINAFSVCESCKSVLRCKNCDHPLTSTKEGNFRCLSCGYVTTLFPNCPTCGHLTFRHVGFGTEKIEKEVRKLLPKARVARLDSTTLRDSKILETTFEKGMKGEIDVLIGTQMILKAPPLPNLALVAMIDADSLLLFPDFQADERLFRDLSRAVRQVAHTPKGRVFVQTFRPEGAFFQKIAERNSTAMLEYILAERQELSYPPFFRFLILTCQGKTEKKTTMEAQALFTDIERILPKTYRLTSPRPTTFLKKKTRFESAILIRFPEGEPLPENLRVLLRKNSKDCSIDIDPITIR